MASPRGSQRSGASSQGEGATETTSFLPKDARAPSFSPALGVNGAGNGMNKMGSLSNGNLTQAQSLASQTSPTGAGRRTTQWIQPTRAWDADAYDMGAEEANPAYALATNPYSDVSESDFSQPSFSGSAASKASRAPANALDAPWAAHYDMGAASENKREGPHYDLPGQSNGNGGGVIGHGSSAPHYDMGASSSTYASPNHENHPTYALASASEVPLPHQPQYDAATTGGDGSHYTLAQTYATPRQSAAAGGPSAVYDEAGASSEALYADATHDGVNNEYTTPPTFPTSSPSDNYDAFLGPTMNPSYEAPVPGQEQVYYLQKQREAAESNQYFDPFPAPATATTKSTNNKENGATNKNKRLGLILLLVLLVCGGVAAGVALGLASSSNSAAPVSAANSSASSSGPASNASSLSNTAGNTTTTTVMMTVAGMSTTVGVGGGVTAGATTTATTTTSSTSTTTSTTSTTTSTTTTMTTMTTVGASSSASTGGVTTPVATTVATTAPTTTTPTTVTTATTTTTADKPRLYKQMDTGAPYFALPAGASGGGGLVSTIHDYTRFCHMLLNGGELDGTRLLGPHTLDLMMRNHLNGDLAAIGKPTYLNMHRPGVGFGLGFAICLNPARIPLLCAEGEASWGGMASTCFFVDRTNGIAAILMTQLVPSSTYTFRKSLRSLVYQALLE
eukprot:m.203555 g.203555  ORF g.203555 m.203555 type:complete len:679 (-) comp15520_c2_seq7:4490-6526(-)